MPKQKAFAVVGIRVPAPEMRIFPKRSSRLSLALDPDLRDAIEDLAARRTRNSSLTPTSA